MRPIPLNWFPPLKTLLKNKASLILFCAVPLVCLLYKNTLETPFLFDGNLNIKNNPAIRLNHLSLEAIKTALVESPAISRPIPVLSFAINYYFHQYQVEGYHVVNIALHLLTGILLFIFIMELFSLTKRLPSTKGPPFSPLVGVMAVVIWWVHPIQTQSVTYIVQRMTLFAALFYLLSSVSYIKARQSSRPFIRFSWYMATFVFGVCALGSKENTVTLPFLIYLLEWFFFQDLSGKWLKQQIKYWIFIWGGLVSLLLIVPHLIGDSFFHLLLKGYETYDFTLTQRLFSELRGICLYISLLFFPHPSRLNIDYDFPISFSLFFPITTALSAVALILLIVLACYTAKKNRLLSFCILWFLGHLIIESTIIPLDLVFEHRLYFPSMLVMLGWGIFIERSLHSRKYLKTIVYLVVVFIFSLWTLERNLVWRDSITLWQDCVLKSPQKARPRNNLGIALLDAGKLQQSRDQFLKAIDLNPKYAVAYNNLGKTLLKLGDLKSAVNYLEKAVSIRPEYAEAHINLGAAYNASNHLQKAFAHYQTALKLHPKSAEGYNNLGILFELNNQLETALTYYQKALDLNPDFAETFNNIGNIYYKKGAFTKAAFYFKQAIALNAHYADAYYNLGNLYAKQGTPLEAIAAYQNALTIFPENAEVLNNIGILEAQIGQLPKALAHFKKALLLKPNYKEAQRNLRIAQQMMTQE